MEFPELNQKDVLNALNIKWKKLREYEESGDLRAIRISLGTVRYFQSDIDKLKNKKREEASENEKS